jgi:hypothetical protein
MEMENLQVTGPDKMPFTENVPMEENDEQSSE